MRIIGGRMRGLGLTPVGKGDEGAHLRPTTDRVRESLFNLLGGGRFGDPIQDAVVLDLFAGTGAIGLEALSRGARTVTFVENGRTGTRLLNANIAKARASDDTRVLRRDATRLGSNDRESASLVFLDPPYGKGMGTRALIAAREGGWVAPDAIIVIEEASQQAPPPGFSPLDARRYGDTWLTLLSCDGTD